jgi:siroheme synthase (precorrin-2 oxidase/ferrochelatase)
MYMPLMIDLQKVVVFAGEREEGLQKTEKMAVFADDLLVVPEDDSAPSEIHLEAGPLNRVPESLSLEKPRTIPVADQPATADNIEQYVEGATFVTSDLDDEQLNERIAEVCDDHNILCNIIDVKELCDTWLMSVIDAPNMIAGISSKGGCAFYSQRTRIELEDDFRHRSEVSRVFTELRGETTEEQCNLCALGEVYEHEDIQTLMDTEQWDQVLSRGRTMLEELPDDFCVRDHSVRGLEEEAVS